MAVDYDLVIIGSSAAGIYAARQAVQLQARVALVTQTNELYLPNEQLFSYQLGEMGRLNRQLIPTLFESESNKKQAKVSLSSASAWIENARSEISDRESLPNLAALGVDVISGYGRFNSQPRLELLVNNRQLRSRNFLLATGVKVSAKSFEQYDFKAFLTLGDLNKIDLSTLSNQIIIVGSNPTALELAQTLSRFNKQVTLVVESSRIMPQEDLDIAILIQAQLEAEGIQILTSSPVSQIKQIDQQKWLQVGDRALTAGEIIITDHHQPNVSGLNLAKVNVKYNQRQVFVNQKLQTTNPSIYACGELIGGFCLPNIAQYEASIVLKNTLFFSWHKVNYLCQPWAVLTEPNLARVGLNEIQAKQQYDNDIYVINQYFKNPDRTPRIDNQGFCKLIVQKNGAIIGCSLVCDRAAELISLVALMIKYKFKLQSNPIKGLTSMTIPTVDPSLNGILNQASENFYQQKISRQPKISKRLSSWFSVRKSWHQ